MLNQVITPSEKAVTQKESVLGQLKNVLNLDVKSLLYNKVLGALEDNLNVAVEISEPVKFTNTVAPLDLIRILSNLMDNAIKAAKQSKDKKVSVALFVKNHQQWIVIGNSTQEKALNLQQLSNSHGNLESSHGLGLKNLQMILARYPQVQHEVSSNNYWLEQSIIIPQK